jgi:hypothetical protein
MQSTLEETTPDLAWPELAPLLDEAMGRLGATDRDAVVLRYFENKTLPEVGAALGMEERAAQKRVHRALEKLRKFFSKRGVAATTTIIAGAMSAHSVQAAPMALAQSVTAAALTKGAAASGSTLILIKGALKLMAWTKMKTAAVTTAVILLTAGTGVGVVKTLHAVRVAHAPDLAGAWAGIFDNQGMKAPLMYKLSKVNGAYHAVEEDIYQGRRDVPVSKFTYDYPAIHLEQQAIGFTYDATLNPHTMEMSGTWKQSGGSGPFTMKLNALAEAFPEPLTESEYAARNDSDLQGYWRGTVQVGNASLRMALKIAERPDKTFRVEWDNPDQGSENIEATAVSYQAPAVKVEFGGAGIVMEGRVDRSDRVITGNVIQQGRSTPLTLERAKPESVAGQDAELEAQKDYSHTGPNDLPGHWQGTLEVKQTGQKIRLALNIAKMPGDAFFASLGSPDMGGANQDIRELSASTVQYAPPEVTLEWPAIGGTYQAKLENGKLTGVWRQGGVALPLVMERNRAR